MDNSSTNQRKLNEAIESGQYKIAGLDMFNIIENIELEDKIIGLLEYTEDLLAEYLQEINLLKDHEPGLIEYLQAMKNGDIIDNQNMEKENSFLIGLYMQLSKESAIDKLIKYIKEKQPLTDKEIYKIHETLLYGTSSKDVETIRTKNNTFVAKTINGQKTFDYFPIDFKDANQATKIIATLYNQRLTNKAFDNIFIQPFLIHGLLGALQIFGDGNTRMGRIMQHTLIWQLINERTSFNFELPPLYATRNYYPYRETYRKLISQLVNENNNQVWNEWFKFNLKRIQDQIYKNNENLYEFKRSNPKKRIIERW